MSPKRRCPLTGLQSAKMWNNNIALTVVISNLTPLSWSMKWISTVATEARDIRKYFETNHVHFLLNPFRITIHNHPKLTHSTLPHVWQPSQLSLYWTTFYHLRILFSTQWDCHNKVRTGKNMEAVVAYQTRPASFLSSFPYFLSYPVFILFVCFL
jgi:hypothetical protein